MLKYLSTSALALTLIGSLVSTTANAECSKNWRGERVCTPPKRVVVVVKPRRHHNSHSDLWRAVATVAGVAIIVDSLGNPTVEGKTSVVIETKLIKIGQVDVIEKAGQIYFIKGIG